MQGCQLQTVQEGSSPPLSISCQPTAEESRCLALSQKDHLPKTCLEVSEDSKINAVHQVEGEKRSLISQSSKTALIPLSAASRFTEAMSRALIRKCPKCSEPYIKEADS